MTFLLVLSYTVLDQERETDWKERCGELMDVPGSVEQSQKRIALLDQEFQNLRTSENRIKCLRKLRSERAHLKRLVHIGNTGRKLPSYRQIFHLIILPNYGEDIEVLRASFRSIQKTNYPLDRLMIIAAFEEREGKMAHEKAAILSREFQSIFYKLMTTFHPEDLPGEHAVKGANATWAAKQAAAFLSEEQIPFENVIVSCFDADTCVGQEYFSCLTYNFMIRPDRLRCSFQPIPVYHNNVWDVPAFARIMETGSSFYQLIESANPDHLVTFSSHSMSFQSLVEAGYWPVDMISDDSAIFWRCFLHFKGEYRTVPLYVTLSMSIVVGQNWLDTFKKLYVQKRRWAWGIENFPFVMEGFIHEKEIRLSEKIKHGFKMLESHVSWATWGLVVTFLGWLPVILGGREYGVSVISYNLPKITQMVFHLAGVSLVVSIVLSILLLPKRPKNVALIHRFAFLVQWLLLPIILPFLLALPALDAQTKLLLGRYIEFNVSSKVRQSRAQQNQPAGSARAVSVNR